MRLHKQYPSEQCSAETSNYEIDACVVSADNVSSFLGKEFLVHCRILGRIIVCKTQNTERTVNYTYDACDDEKYCHKETIVQLVRKKMAKIIQRPPTVTIKLVKTLNRPSADFSLIN